MDVCAARRGASMGPAAIRFAGLREGLEHWGHSVRDMGDIVRPQSGGDRESLVGEVNRRLYESVLGSLDQGRFPVVLGGDRSIAAGCIAAASKKHDGNLGLIWIDARGDCDGEGLARNRSDLASVCGLGPAGMTGYARGTGPVDPRRCVHIGETEPGGDEARHMREAGVTFFPAQVVKRQGMEAVIRQAIQIAGAGTNGTHLSIDISAVSPEAVPGTGVLIYPSLTPQGAFTAMEALSKCGALCSLDVVEVNPILDVGNRNGILAAELIQAALGGTAF